MSAVEYKTILLDGHIKNLVLKKFMKIEKNVAMMLDTSFLEKIGKINILFHYTMTAIQAAGCIAGSAGYELALRMLGASRGA